MKKFFLHGLESSGNGTKGRFFKENFSEMIVADYSGTLQSRLQQFEKLCGDSNDLVLVGSSFGGLMATCFAVASPSRVKKLVLMAPALNFPGFQVPQHKISTPTYLLIGSLDDLTPAARVIPLAEQTFSNIEIQMVEEDHMLHQSFSKLDWKKLLTVE
jgi:predicted esterase